MVSNYLLLTLFLSFLTNFKSIKMEDLIESQCAKSEYGVLKFDSVGVRQTFDFKYQGTGKNIGSSTILPCQTI